MIRRTANGSFGTVTSYDFSRDIVNLFHQVAVVVVRFVKVEKREKKRAELRNIKRKHKRIWCRILHSIG